MKSLEELTRTEGYWLTTIQSDLYAKVEAFRQARGWTRTQLAQHLGVSKGYVSQVLNGDFDHKLSSLVRLALAVDTVPNLKFQDPASRNLAFNQLVRKYQSKVYWHVRKMVVDHADADDLTQDVFIKVWKQIGRASCRERV